MAISENELRGGELLGFSALELFSIVLDVEKYPEFLPWCEDVIIVSKGEGFMDVELVAKFMSIEGRYTSRVRFFAPTQESEGWIKAESKDGVFKSLRCEWGFVPKGEKETLVRFFVDFSFKSRVFQFAFDMFSNMAKSHITRAFRNRAYRILK